MHRHAALAAALLLAACATRPPADGAPAEVPAGLERIPDAEPRVEPLRVGGPNKPYEVLGQRYVPITDDRPLREAGLASWYGTKFHGRPTATGEPYDMFAMSAAHKTMPLPSYARVRNPANGREVIVRVNDRGPFHPGRVIDLSYAAALRLGLLGGVAPVELERLTHDQIRSAAWRRDRSAPPPQAPPDGDPLLALVAGDSPGPGFWLQLGSFRDRPAAEALGQRVQRQSDAPQVLVRDGGGLFRVHAGPYLRRFEALDAAERLKDSLGIVPLVLERLR